MCHPVCSVSVTPSKTRLIGFCYKWKIQSIATERSSRVSLRSTQLFLTVSIRLGSWSSNSYLLDGSTERRLMLAEVEPSNVLGGWLTDVGRHFRLFVVHTMPEVTTGWGGGAIRFAPCLHHPATLGWTERSSRVSLRSTQLFLTVSMRSGYWSSNDDLLDGSTERRLTLAEVEPSNGLGGWFTDVGPHFRLIVFYAMPEVTTFWEGCAIRFAP